MLKQFKFIITTHKERIAYILSDNIEDARQELVNREIESGEGLPDDIIDDGVEV